MVMTLVSNKNNTHNCRLFTHDLLASCDLLRCSFVIIANPASAVSRPLLCIWALAFLIKCSVLSCQWHAQNVCCANWADGHIRRRPCKADTVLVQLIWCEFKVKSALHCTISIPIVPSETKKKKSRSIKEISVTMLRWWSCQWRHGMYHWNPRQPVTKFWL